MEGLHTHPTSDGWLLSPLPYLRPPDPAGQAQIDGHHPIGILLRRGPILPRLLLRHRLLPQLRRGRQFLPAAIAEASILTQHGSPPSASSAPRPSPAALPPLRRPPTSQTGTCPFPTRPTPTPWPPAPPRRPAIQSTSSRPPPSPAAPAAPRHAPRPRCWRRTCL